MTDADRAREILAAEQVKAGGFGAGNIREGRSAVVDSDTAIAAILTALATPPRVAESGEVIQADREAAAVFETHPQAARAVIAGRSDGSIFVQAFRDHRLSALRAFPASQAREGEQSPELVEIIRQWLMSTDYEVSDWERQFAAAIEAMLTAAGWSRPAALTPSPVVGEAEGEPIVPAFIRMGLCDTVAEVCRLIQGGGARVNGQKVAGIPRVRVGDKLSAGSKHHAILTPSVGEQEL